MKCIKIGFLSLLLMIFGLLPWTAMALETDGGDFSVNFTVQQDTLRLEMEGIPTENPRQMLSVLVIHRDADKAQPTPGDILYANALYLNGRTAFTLDIDTGGRDAREYRLIIGDSTGAVAYSELLGPETTDSTNSTNSTNSTPSTTSSDAPETGEASLAGMAMLAVTGGLITVMLCWNKRRINGGTK